MSKKHDERSQLIQRTLQEMVEAAQKRQRENASFDKKTAMENRNLLNLPVKSKGEEMDGAAAIEKIAVDALYSAASDGKNEQDGQAGNSKAQHEEAAFIRRAAEALIFASEQPVTLKHLAEKLGTKTNWPGLIARLKKDFSDRGFELVKVAGGYRFQTKPEFAALIAPDHEMNSKLSQAALEVLAIIAYHQPVSRADIEAIRGVFLGRDLLDKLLELGWIKYGRRRKTPGRPMTFATTSEFLSHFHLEGIEALPGMQELKQSGLLSPTPPSDLDALLARADELADGGIDMDQEGNLGGTETEIEFMQDYLSQEK